MYFCVCVCVCYCGDKFGFRLVCDMRVLRLIFGVLVFVSEIDLVTIFAREDTLKEVSYSLISMENGK